VQRRNERSQRKQGGARVEQSVLTPVVYLSCLVRLHGPSFVHLGFFHLSLQLVYNLCSNHGQLAVEKVLWSCRSEVSERRLQVVLVASDLSPILCQSSSPWSYWTLEATPSVQGFAKPWNPNHLLAVSHGSNLCGCSCGFLRTACETRGVQIY
jgi:hypothetical protein